MNIETNIIQHLPLNVLVRSPYNVRSAGKTKEQKEASKADVAGLADNIAALGLLQNLVVHEMADCSGIFGVAAGWTRRLALELLVDTGRRSADELVPCRVISAVDALQTSLAENVHRSAMHPADQFLAFKALIDGGKTVEEVAAVFAATPQVILRRLALANVAPAFIEMYRKDEVKLDVLMALAATTDHQKQLSVWKSLPNYARNAHGVRERLNDGEINAKRDRIARYVGVKAYEQAGGQCRIDLFANEDDDESGIYILDGELLQRLAQLKLDKRIAAVKGEGFSWVEARLTVTYSERHAFGSVPMIRRKLSKSDAKKLATLEAAIEELEARPDPADEDESDAAFEELQGKRDALEEFESTLQEPDPAYTDFVGAIITIGDSGKTEIIRGLVRPEDKSKIRKVVAARNVDDPNGAAESESNAKAGYSERVNRTLSAHVTSALQVSIARNPNLALATLVHKLAIELFFGFDDRPTEGSVAGVSLTDSSSTDFVPEDDAARLALRTEYDRWYSRMPKHELLGWLISLSTDELLDLLAVCTAHSIHVGTHHAKLEHDAVRLAKAANLDMTQWWTPTKDRFLKDLTKADLAQAITDVGNVEAAAKIPTVKKMDAIELTAAELAGKSWLPPVMRFQ